MFTVMVFFTFSIFAFHPTLSGENMNSNVTQGMYVAAGIIYVFSFFFVLYSMSAFLQSRKKEFGLLMMQGMSMRQIRSMVFLENMLIGFFATLIGVALGLVFAKGILLLAENVLIIEDRLQFYFPIEAIILSFVSFILLFFVISLFVSYVLRSRKLIDLIKGDKKSKGEPKASILLTLLAALLLGAGYTVSLIVEGVAVVAALIPVVIVVIIGTYFLFTQLSVFVIRKLKNRKSIFWNKTNMLLLSDLSFRMKDNARTFFMVAIISTVAFCAIGSLFGFQSVLTDTVKTAYPNPLSYQGYEHDVELDEQNVALINETLAEQGITTDTEQMKLRYYQVGEDPNILIAKQSDYNKFAQLIDEEPISLEPGDLKVIEYEGASFGQTEELINQTIDLNSGVTLTPDDDVIYSQALPQPDSYYVISDEDYEQLPEPTQQYSYQAWQVIDGEEAVFEASEKLYEVIPFRGFTSVEYQVYQTNKGYGPILFVGLFIGIVFFVSAGSFLYFRLYADLDDDKQKFRAIAKMGLTNKELKKVLNRQTALLFFAPIVVALIHGAIALTALSNMFQYDLFFESVTVLGVFLAIQIVYFFIVRYFYTKQIKAAIS